MMPKAKNVANTIPSAASDFKRVLIIIKRTKPAPNKPAVAANKKITPGLRSEL